MAESALEESLAEKLSTVHTDVGFANQYRLELIKTTMTLATGLLAFTVTFRPSLLEPRYDFLIWIGWLALGLSTCGAMINLYGWEKIYISYRDYRNDPSAGNRVREKITQWRRFAMVLQVAGFGVGLLAVALFSALNLDNVRPPS